VAANRAVLDLFYAMGIIYISPNRRHYSPTELAVKLTAHAQRDRRTAATGAAGGLGVQAPHAAAASAAPGEEGFIILETTFRLYAFTSNVLHHALLSLFARIDFRLPSLLVCVITKESVRGALKNDIAAKDIVQYLTAYAHPQLQRSNRVAQRTMT
jgi:transcription initiation factor TFIIH subunit 4